MSQAHRQTPAPLRGAQPQAAPAAAEIAAVLDRATGARLADAERLAASLPAMLGDDLTSVELFLSAGTFIALARVSARGPDARRRVVFWCARAGARSVVLGDLGERERAAFKATLARCPRSVIAEPGALAAEARGFFTAAGLAGDRPEVPALPVLRLEVDGPDWEATRWDADARRLFVSGALAPPAGDPLLLSLRLAGGQGPRCWARVVEVRTPDQAGPGLPPGFLLGLVEPPSELVLFLDQRAPGGEARYEKRRTHPRYPVRAPAQVTAGAAAGAGGDAGAAEPMANLGGSRFALENLSLGGAFIRTATPPLPGATVHVEATLPTGDRLAADAEVVFAAERGMGVRWTAGSAAEEELAEVVTRVASMSRRAVVIDDDAIARKMLADALQERGFEVVCAEDGMTGLHVVLEELLSLDLLVTDLWMPQMDGEGLLRTIRDAGGERDLAVVVVSGRLEAGLEDKLRREGADAVLEKSLGPALTAQAAAAALERKRSGRG